MKILLIQLQGQINAGCATNVIHSIKEQYPNAPIHVVTEYALAAYYTNIPQLAKVFTLKADIMPTIMEMLLEKYSHCIDLSNSTRSFIIRTYLGQQYNSILEKSKYPTTIWPRPKHFKVNNLSTKFVESVKWLKPQKLFATWPFFVTEKDDLKKDDLPLSHKAGYYCLDITQSNFIHIYEHLLAKIAMPVILVGENLALSKKLKAIDNFKIYDAVGKFTPGEIYNILKDSFLNIVVSNNIGFMAVATQKKIVQIGGQPLPIADLKPYANTKNYLPETEQLSFIEGFILSGLNKS